VTGVTLDKQNATIMLGGQFESRFVVFVVTVIPENATNKNVTFSSSNEAVATVGNGIVEGISPGITFITATTEDGEFKANCEVTVVESDTQRTALRYSSDKREAAAKMRGFSENDFEVVDGNVVIKKSIAETIVRNLLDTDDFEILLIPLFEAEFLRNGQDGKIAVVNTKAKKSMLTGTASNSYDETLLLSIISPNTGEFLKFSSSEFDDGMFWVIPAPARPIIPPHEEVDPVFAIYIRDGGRFDLDKTENGSVVGQIAIVKDKLEEYPTEPTNPTEITNPTNPEIKPINTKGQIDPGSSGGCNASYFSITLLLTCLGLFANNRKIKL